MTNRIITAALAMTVLSACSQGQKGQVELKNEIDSVSYAIGADIGANFKRSKLDNVNLDAMRMGLKDGLDSAVMMDGTTLESVVQNYMMKLQEERMAEEKVLGEQAREAGEAFLAENGKRDGVITTASGLQYEVKSMGAGARPADTDRVTVHYTGTLTDGSEFDSSVKRGVPATFGLNQVIRGWTEGLQLMPAGSKFRFFIPSELGYGAGGAPGGAIPPNSVLIFDVELLEIAE